MQHRFFHVLLRFVALVATLLLARAASANGRYPGADEFLLSPAEPQTRFVHGSFGFFLSKDAGATWRWVCDDVIEPSLAADSVSPSVAVFERGALAVATVAGVKTSTDDGCSFATAPGTEGLRMRDIAKVRHAGRAVAITAPPDGSASTVLETTDDGVSWHVIGTPLPVELVVQNIEVTDSDPDRLYVSGTAQFSYEPGQLAEAGLPTNRVGVVYTSRDHGATWIRTIVPQATSITSDVYVSAVDPSNADLVYARSAFSGAGAGTERDGVVLASHDGARTFDVVLRAPHAALLGFALSPTGDRIAVALANADAMDGTWVAPRDSLVFEHRAPDVLSCLAWGADGLFACQNLFTPSCNPTCPYVVASSANDAQTWTPLLTKLSDIIGPLDCPATSAFPGICLPVWESTWKCKLEDCDAGVAWSGASADGGVVTGVTAGASGCDAPGTTSADLGGVASGLGAALLVLAAVALRRLLRQREAAARVAVVAETVSAVEPGILPKITFETEDEESDATKVGANAGDPVQLDATILQSFVDDDAIIDEPTHVSALVVTSARSRTDRGLRRRQNEDSLLVLDEHGVFVVADGMGGYAGGARASHLAVDVVAETFEKNAFGIDDHPRLPRRATQLARAVQLANEAILDEARSAPALRGMGTTIAAARFSNDKQRLYIAHVGDSRIYRLRNDELVPLTEDHTMAALGVTGPSSVLLSRAVGIAPNVVVDIGLVKPVPGDRYLLCSDGLTKMVSQDEIGAILATRTDLSEAVEALVDASNAHGGSDNVTVIVVQVDAPAASA